MLLHQLKRKRNWSDDELHAAVGVDSVTDLSAKEASQHIDRLGGGGLANPPGQKPSPYSGSKRQPGVTRMITNDHVTHIHRLLDVYFGNRDKAASWLSTNFDASHIRDLATAARAGQVIRVLREMIQRKESPNAN